MVGPLAYRKQELITYIFLQAKMIFIHRQEAVLLHFTQFVGKSTAIDAQVIRQLLPVERNGEIQAFVPRGLIGQVGNQAPPDGLGRGMENPAGQIQVFLGGYRQQVADQLAVV